MSSAAGLKAEEGAASSIRSFPPFPHELLSRIIHFACHLPPLRPNEAAGALPPPPRSALDLDLATTSSLALVCQGFYAATTPILYAHVRLTQPSALESFQRTLASRPLLGALVRSLHIGPDDNELGDWWPMSYVPGQNSPRIVGDPVCWFSTSLRARRDRDLVPRWCQEQKFPLQVLHVPPDCRGRAISEAITVAEQTIDADLLREDWSWSCRQITPAEWTKRILEMQAALDLFLAAMRLREDNSSDYRDSWRAKPPGCDTDKETPYPCRAGTCDHYQALKLVGWESTPRGSRKVRDDSPSQPRESLVVIRSQVLQHLARRRGPTDRFDHPLLFLRSGASLYELEYDGRVGGSDPDRSREAPDFSVHEREDGSGDFPVGPIRTLKRRGKVDVALPNTATIASLLSLARSVLAFCQKVTNLSLTGFLERAVCDEQPPPQLSYLRSLSLGPAPPHWQTDMHLDHAVFKQVKRLRIAGVMLYAEEVEAINQTFGQLEKMEWVLAGRYEARWDLNLFDTIDELLNPGASSSSRGEEGNGEEKPASVQKEADMDQDDADESRKPLPLVEIKLHAADVAAVLSKAEASSTATREALLRGDPLPGDTAARRVMLSESNAARVGVSRRSREMISDGWIVLYGEGREWWARHGG